MKKRMVVVYDGIHNPVFESQVMQPLVKQLDQHPHEQGIIISFERKRIPQEEQTKLIPDSRITLITLHKLPFFGTIALRYAVRQLRPVIQQYQPDTITCRGPMAAWIVGHLKLPKYAFCTVQARGLAAQEHRYAHPSLPHRFRAWQYEQIEHWVYSTYASHHQVTIQAVSEALKQYLIKTFTAPSKKITVAVHDIPPIISPEQRIAWRAAVRNELGICPVTHVYVYNGSAKPWQCPHETVQFFVTEHKKNPNSFLLVLTQDRETFTTLLKPRNLPSHSYRVMHASHTQIYRYLAAADSGILLRKPHIINWVSRPTKALEYRAVGLKIIHNNTVGMLCK